MRLSVIIPAHNEEKYIGKTLAKMPSEAEVIVVCNGCTDRTFDEAQKFENVKVFNIPEKSVSKARNYGAKRCQKARCLFFLTQTSCLKEA